MSDTDKPEAEGEGGDFDPNPTNTIQAPLDHRACAPLLVQGMARAQVVQTGIGWRRDQVLRVFHLLLLPIRGTWCVDVNGVTHEVTAPDGGLFVPVQNNRRLYTQSEGTADYSHEAVIVLIDPLHFQWSQQVALVGNAGRTLAAGLWGVCRMSL